MKILIKKSVLNKLLVTMTNLILNSFIKKSALNKPLVTMTSLILISFIKKLVLNKPLVMMTNLILISFIKKPPLNKPQLGIKLTLDLFTLILTSNFGKCAISVNMEAFILG